MVGRVDPRSHRAATAPAPALLDNGPANDIEGAWVLNPVWSGYMGVAIKFNRDGGFEYWFYSDHHVAGNQPKYPIRGTWKRSGNTVELQAEHSLHLHDTRWHVCQHEGQPALLPEYARQWQLKDGKAHDDRLLFRVAGFDPTRPFSSQSLEQMPDRKGERKRPLLR